MACDGHKGDKERLSSGQDNGALHVKILSKVDIWAISSLNIEFFP
jgi:hypothetical protein